MSESGIEIENLRLSFSGTFNLSIPFLRLSPRAPTMILGPNGAGKSVFLRLLHGLLKADHGRIEYPEQYRDLSSQSMVFQRPVLLRRTALENIMFPLHARGMSKANALVQAKTWMVRAELEKRFHSPARRLSGGEQQRLALARALALSPKVIILDEPCAHLDPNAAVKVEALIQTAIKEGVKVIMVTHNAAQAERLGEELILMRDGKIIAHHPKETFFTQTSNEDLTRFLAGHPLKGVL